MKARAFEVEQVAIERFDEVATTVATKLGYQTVPWFRITLYLTYIYTALTCMVMFYRPDFYNVRITV